jgi:thymidylate synthase
MRISELPQEIKELALLRQKERPNNSESDYLDEAFSWYYTEEGTTYWNEWNLKDFVEPKNYDDVITIIETKIATMSSRGFESYYLPIGILKDLIREIKEIK